MRINSVNNNYRAAFANTKKSLSFGQFNYDKIGEESKQLIVKALGGQQRADLFEKVATDKNLVVTFLNEKTQRNTTTSFLSLAAKIFDKQPAQGQNAEKLINSGDTRTLTDEAIQKLFSDLVSKYPGMERIKIFELMMPELQNIRMDNFANRLERALIACKAKSENIMLGGALDTQDMQKLYGAENVKEIGDALIKEGSKQYNIDVVAGSTIYNNI